MTYRFPAFQQATVLAALCAGLCVGCMDRNADNIPDEAQPNMPGSAANRAREGLATGEQLAKNAAITGRIKTALLTDKTIHATKINVDTVDGVVTLKGEVPTEEEKSRAEAIAMKTSGVTSVINDLVVSPSQAQDTSRPQATQPK